MYCITVRQGRTLWEELAEQNMVIDRPCGGAGTCGRCKVQLADGTQVYACQYRKPGTVMIAKLPELLPPVGEQAAAVNARNRNFAVVTDTGKAYQPEPEVPQVAMDIGTTTVVLGVFYRHYHVTRTFINPQRVFGADIMSRIRAANEGHTKELQTVMVDAIVNTLNDAWEELRLGGMPAHLKWQDAAIVVSANTTMQHLLEGLSCKTLGEAPFLPVNIRFHEYRMPEAGLPVTFLPGISTFVGADIVSGLAAVDFMHRQQAALFVDLGTNGELALGCRDRLLVTATAAGPAFEGSALALRIHGSGMLRLIRRLLEQNRMDSYGTLCEDYFDTGYPVRVAEYGAEGAANEVVVLTQDDIRQIQMAKAAVCAGVEQLLEIYGITAEQVETVYLAGGFGYYLNPEDAVAIGLLPKSLSGKIHPVGNASYLGALEYIAQPQSCRRRMEAIVDRAEVILLNEYEHFEERYIEDMNF